MVYWLIFLAAAPLAVMILRKKIRLERQHLPVLMYHRVSSNGVKDENTIQSLQLERQFHYLKKEGYTPVLLSQLVDFVLYKKPLPKKPVLITFDDGYRDNYTVMYPLLKQYGINANLFLVASFITGMEYKNSRTAEEYLSLNDILSMDPALVEFGLHSYDHRNFNDLSDFELNDDIRQSIAVLKTLGIPFQPCLAFPYGGYPKNNSQKLAHLYKTLTRNNIILSFRIGNRLNPLPINNPLLIERLDIRGDMSFKEFTRHLHKGKELFPMANLSRGSIQQVLNPVVLKKIKAAETVLS